MPEEKQLEFKKFNHNFYIRIQFIRHLINHNNGMDIIANYYLLKLIIFSMQGAQLNKKYKHLTIICYMQIKTQLTVCQLRLLVTSQVKFLLSDEQQQIKYAFVKLRFMIFGSQGAVIQIQIIILSNIAEALKKFMNQSSSIYSDLRRCDSDDPILGKKYSRKSKTIKKKSHQMGIMGNKKKRCELYDQGICPKGSMCSYSHSFIPDIAKKFCNLYAINICQKGQFCPFSHNSSRYPCRYLFILGKCFSQSSCCFSHLQIDDDFYQEFFDENLEYISKKIKEGEQLTQKCREFTKKISMSERLEEKQKLQNQTKIPFIFGNNMAKNSSTKDSNYQTQAKHKTYKKGSKKDSKAQKPFSIRLSSKNRNPIVQRIFKSSIPQTPRLQEDGQIYAHSWGSKIDEQNIICGKISQCIELTPEQKWDKIEENNQFQF